MSFVPTDANGNPLESTPIAERINDFYSLSYVELLAVAASMSFVLFEFNWKEQFEIFQEALKNGKN